MDGKNDEVSKGTSNEIEDNFLPGTYDNDLSSDEDQPRSSADNIIPTEQLQNGLKTAKNLWLKGWNGVREQWKVIDESEAMSRAKEQWKIIEESEQMAKVREVTAPVVDKTVNGLSEVGQHVGVATQIGVQWTGERFEEAKPHLIELKDKAVIVTKDIQRRLTGGPGDKGGGSQVV